MSPAAHPPLAKPITVRGRSGRSDSAWWRLCRPWRGPVPRLPCVYRPGDDAQPDRAADATAAGGTHCSTPPSREGNDQLDVLAETLRRRGWDARVVRYEVAGDVDVRLDVGDHEPPGVELLGGCGGLSCHDRWEAVRITDDGRAVWAGPRHDCTQADVIVFIEDLLLGDDHDLARRYTRLG